MAGGLSRDAPVPRRTRGACLGVLVYNGSRPAPPAAAVTANCLHSTDYSRHSRYICTVYSLCDIIQIVTGIEVNSESYLPKLREYCPSAEGMQAIFPQLREIRLTIDR